MNSKNELKKIMSYKYPLLEYFMTEKECLTKFNELKHKKFNQMKKGNWQIEINYDIDKHYNRITDYFTNFCRMQCIFRGSKMSPYEYYQKHKLAVLDNSLKDGKFDYDKFEDYIFNKTRMCNNYQISIIMEIFHYFKPKRVFDSSAGWGDRLISSIAFNADYLGFDPSNCLEPLYKRIINTLAPNEENKYKVLSMPFEKVKNSDVNGKFDLAFTSPPFWDVEVYENNEKQSISGFKTEEEWVIGFLNKLAELNIKYLESGGHFVIYVPEYPGFIDYMKKNKDVEFCGEIFYFYKGAPHKKRKILVWKKK